VPGACHLEIVTSWHSKIKKGLIMESMRGHTIMKLNRHRAAVDQSAPSGTATQNAIHGSQTHRPNQKNSRLCWAVYTILIRQKWAMVEGRWQQETTGSEAYAG